MSTYESNIFVTVVFLYLAATIYGLENSFKINSKNGNLIFEAALDRNITFLLKGKSRLNVNDEYDILKVLLELKNKIAYNSIYTTEPVWSTELELTQTELPATVESLNKLVFGHNGAEFQCHEIENRTKDAENALRRYNSRLLRIEGRIQNLYDKLERDSCKIMQCQNGGTCLNIFGNSVCKCPKSFEGSFCEKDVNECLLYAGTDLGCQNGAQCVNKLGSFDCICQPGWFGIHCSQRNGDCLQSSVWELCGHGTCAASNDSFGYKCICDPGWKTNGITPACLEDVNECTDGSTACITKCINLPGSFVCAPCPAGLTGNGVHCQDIDECSIENGGCSLSPKVKCLNTYGSYHCGECPLGWVGDGHLCERTTSTDSKSSDLNKGAIRTCAHDTICHPQAKCLEISNTIVCTCPPGMEGSGIGINGCILASVESCISQPCLNGGTCVDSSDGFSCNCPLGFTGPICNSSESVCTPNPCYNGGRCILIKTSTTLNYECECHPVYAGANCEKLVNDCSGIMKAKEGDFSYPFGHGSTHEHNSQCAWIIRTNERFILNLTFNKFNLEDDSECRFNWLQIHDGHDTESPLIGRFCGTLKPLGGNILSSTHELYLWFRSFNSTTKENFTIEWDSIQPQCGGLINITRHGTISSPGFPNQYPKNRDCRWILRAPTDRRIKLTFFNLQLENHNSCNYDYLEITDGISGKTLKKFCNSTLPQDLLLYTNEATIRFHSDNAGSDIGFQIFYAAEDGERNCGGVYNGKDGIIRSPLIPNGIVSCEYKIYAAVGKKIILRFLVFEMAVQDCMEIYDVTSTSNEDILQAIYCGDYGSKPPYTKSHFNKIKIKFYGITGAKFKIKYDITTCYFTFDASEGVIQSYSYPQMSRGKYFCIYKILAEPKTVISFHVEDFDLNDSRNNGTDCHYSKLGISEIESKSNFYCNEKTPPVDIISKGNLVNLFFKSSETFNGRGFKLFYKTIPLLSAECGGFVPLPGYPIRTPNVEEDYYMQNKVCYWLILPPKTNLS